MHKFIDNIINAIIDSKLDGLLQQAVKNKEVYTVYYPNAVYQLYALSNKQRKENATFINFDDCVDILKDKYSMDKNKDLIIFKIEYITSYFKIPIIEYKIFTENGVKRLNLNYCYNLKAVYHIPKVIEDYEEYKYNPKHIYYHDKCSLIKSDDKFDLTLPDRKNKFNDYNMSLCESICEFKSYTNQYIECVCDIKLKFNSFLNEKSDKYNIIYRFEKDDSNPINFWTLKCFLNQNIKGILLFNGCSIFIFIILIFIIAGAFIFYLYEQNLLFQKIRILTKIRFKSKMPIEEEKDNLENIKEKKDVKDNGIKKNEANGIINDNIYLDENNNFDVNNIYSNKLNINKMKVKGNIINKNNFSRISINSSKFTLFENKRKFLNRNKNIMLEKIKYLYLEKSDYEISLLNYEEAINKIQKKFSEHLISLLNTRFILLFVFRKQKKNDFDSKIVKICYFLFIIVIYFTFNTLFADIPSFHNMYLNKSNLDFVSNIDKIIYATLISYVLQKLIAVATFTNSTIIQIKNCEMKKKEEMIENVHYCVTIKCVMFFSLSIIMTIFFWFYIGCFCTFFPKTQIYLFLITFLSIIISFIYSLIILFLSAFIRFYSLNEPNRDNLYKFSQFLQVI